MSKVKQVLRSIKLQLLKLLGSLVNPHSRRILFITSLYFQLTRKETASDEMMEKLNKVMELASVTPSSLRLPAQFHHLFWDEEKLKQVLKGCDASETECLWDQALSTDIDQVSKGILTVTPSWLRYGREETMLKDLRRLLFWHDKDVAA